jgi:hypothetical protein
MALDIFSPDYSLITFNNKPDWNCVEDVSECLPITNFSDLKFQYFINFGTLNPILYRKTFIIPCDCDELKFEPPMDGNAEPEFKFTGLTTEPTDFPYDTLNLITGVAGNTIDDYYTAGQCFKFCFVEALYRISNNALFSTTIIACSNCFVYSPNDCYNSLVEYRNNEDSMSFYYELVPTFKNQIRLPLYLTRPQFPSDKDEYRRSDLTYQNLSEVIRKEFQLKTDYLSDYTHEKIKIALSSDFLKITNENARVADEFISQANYSIDWNEDIELKQAQATATLVLSEALAYRNSNCETVDSNACPNVEIIDQDDVVIAVVGSGDEYEVIRATVVNGGKPNTVFINEIVKFV